MKREKQEQLWVESPSLEHTAPVCTALAENEDSTVEQQWAYCSDTGNSSNDAPNNEEAEPNLESDHPIKCYPCDPEYEQNGSDWDWTPLGASSTTTPTKAPTACLVALPTTPAIPHTAQAVRTKTTPAKSTSTAVAARQPLSAHQIERVHELYTQLSGLEYAVFEWERTGNPLGVQKIKTEITKLNRIRRGIVGCGLWVRQRAIILRMQSLSTP